MQSLYILSVSLASDFLSKLVFEYVALQEHYLIASITIFVYRRKALVLRDYQRDFIIRLEKNRINQEIE